MLDAGVGHIPEDRQRRGLVLEFSIAENIALHDYNAAPASRFGWLFPTAPGRAARTLIREFDIRGGGPNTPGGSLSAATSRRSWPRGDRARPEGARRRPADPRPRRRRDRVLAPAAHRRARRGSGDPADLARARRGVSLSDRILVMYEGQVVGEHEPGVTEEEIGLEMLGVRRKETAA